MPPAGRCVVEPVGGQVFDGQSNVRRRRAPASRVPVSPVDGASATVPAAQSAPPPHRHTAASRPGTGRSPACPDRRVGRVRVARRRAVAHQVEGAEVGPSRRRRPAVHPPECVADLVLHQIHRRVVTPVPAEVASTDVRRPARVGTAHGGRRHGRPPCRSRRVSRRVLGVGDDEHRIGVASAPTIAGRHRPAARRPLPIVTSPPARTAAGKAVRDRRRSSGSHARGNSATPWRGQWQPQRQTAVDRGPACSGHAADPHLDVVVAVLRHGRSRTAAHQRRRRATGVGADVASPHDTDGRTAIATTAADASTAPIRRRMAAG